MPTVQSSPRQSMQAQLNQDPDDVLMASSDPRAHPGPHRALEDRRRGDTRVVMGRPLDNPHQTDGCDGLNIDKLALDVGGCLPFEVGCPAFTRELRQVC